MAAHSGPTAVLQVIPIEAPTNQWLWIQQIAARTNLIIDWINQHPAAAAAEAASINELQAALQDALRRIEALEAAAGPP